MFIYSLATFFEFLSLLVATDTRFDVISFMTSSNQEVRYLFDTVCVKKVKSQTKAAKC